MKKLLCIIMACAFVLGGCGSKTEKMVCKYSEDGVSDDSTIEYKDDNIVKQKTIRKMDLKNQDVDKSQIKSLMKATKGMYDIEGVTFDYEIEKDYISATTTVDYEKAKMKDLIEVGLVNEFDDKGKKIKRVSFKATKNMLKEVGYKCK